MATIRKVKRKSGVRWEAQIRLSGAGQRTRTFVSYDEAREWVRNTEPEVALERGATVGRTLADAIVRYRRTAFADLSPETQRGYRPLLAWWHDNHGGLELATLTQATLSTIREELRVVRSPSTVNRYVYALSTVLDLAWREWEWIRSNPVARLTKLREPQGRMPSLSVEQIAALLAACERQRPDLRAYVAIALATGMRQGEVLRLRWADVDLTRRVIVLHHTKNRDRRGVPISDPLVPELENLPRRGEYLFPMNHDASRISRDTYRWAFRRAAIAAGLPNLRYHDLRHVAASYMAMDGASLREIAEVLGHRSLNMVKRYSHLTTDHVANVVQRLGAQVLPPPRRTSDSADENAD